MNEIQGLLNTAVGGNLVGRDGIQASVRIADDTILKLAIAVIITTILARAGYVIISNALAK